MATSKFFMARQTGLVNVLTVLSLFAVKVAAFLNATEDAKQLVRTHS